MLWLKMWTVLALGSQNRVPPSQVHKAEADRVESFKGPKARIIPWVTSCRLSHHVLTTLQSVGAASMLAPRFIAEVCPPANTGRVVAIYEIWIQAGTCIRFEVNYGLQINMKPSTNQ